MAVELLDDADNDLAQTTVRVLCAIEKTKPGPGPGRAFTGINAHCPSLRHEQGPSTACGPGQLLLLSQATRSPTSCETFLVA